MTDHPSSPSGITSTQAGLLFATGAFGLWAVNPLFFKLVEHINAFEVVAHRALWSVPVGVAVVLILRRTSDLARVFRTPRLLVRMLVTGLLITINWTLFVWAVSVDLTLDASLGYFINPLFNVVMGYVLLQERLTRAQVFAVALAAIGVLLQTLSAGVFPWVALVLAMSFSLYGFMRKTVDVGPVQGFVAETTLLLPLALALATWFAWSGTAHFTADTNSTLLLIAAGPVTAAPLIFFASAAKRLRYSTLGLMQFFTPSAMFLIAVFLFGEKIDVWKLTGFAFIWLGLIIFSVDTYKADKAERTVS